MFCLGAETSVIDMIPIHVHGCLAIFKTLDFAERNRWFGGVPGTHGDQPVTFSTYYYGLFKS